MMEYPGHTWETVAEHVSPLYFTRFYMKEGAHEAVAKLWLDLQTEVPLVDLKGLAVNDLDAGEVTAAASTAIGYFVAHGDLDYALLALLKQSYSQLWMLEGALPPESEPYVDRLRDMARLILEEVAVTAPQGEGISVRGGAGRPNA